MLCAMSILVGCERSWILTDLEPLDLLRCLDSLRLQRRPPAWLMRRLLASTLTEQCRSQLTMIPSVRRDGRRLCTAGLRWVNGGWQLGQAKGVANTPVAAGT